MKPKASPRPKPKHAPSTSVRFRPDDWQLIERLQRHTRIDSLSELLRYALGVLARKEGLD